jgi:Mu transposase, C-terminal domain
VRVGLDYHVEVESFFYSVPHALIRQQVDLCSPHTIEVFHRGKRVAAHARRYGGWYHGTDPEHSAHRRYAEWTPERAQRWGQTIGPSTEGLIIAAAPRTSSSTAIACASDAPARSPHEPAANCVT